MSWLEYTSILNAAFAQPVTTLISELLKLPLPTKKEPRELLLESGHSCAIILLTVAALEDVTARYCIHINEIPIGTFSAKSFLKKKFPESHLEEIFAVRNGIVHAHQWAIRVQTTPTKLGKIISRHLPENFGNKEFRKVVDLSAGKTRNLGLNAVPLYITRDDAIAVIKTALEIIRWLNDKSEGILGYDSTMVEINGAHIPFIGLSQYLESTS